MVTNILSAFGLDPSRCQVEQLNSGLINRTWKVSAQDASFILQRLNTDVFRSPEVIVENHSRVAEYLEETHPDYLLIVPLMATDGKYLQQDEEGYLYRLMPYVSGSLTVEVVSSASEAYQAAQQFGRFTSRLSGFDACELKPTIPDFHNLLLRFQQFEEAVQKASEVRLTAAGSAIEQAYSHQDIAETYRNIVSENRIPQRVIHHDTKISNVLFDNDGRGICVIDLDTVMGGYFFSDLGDMMRTYLSPVNEEETDFSKIVIRKDYFKAIVDGYLSEMAAILTPGEKDLFVYSGKFLIYMQALRFLTDYLNGDIYYPTRSSEHNLQRAHNQFQLLEKYLDSSEAFSNILSDYFASETRIKA